ncbi:MAG TPA: rhomboid family intramembrane serine protease [Cyclobacteriaceae bacterium]|nr:rhomboid family intramembrane serine protease [Cyclobacteriaceae bacterium]
MDRIKRFPATIILIIVNIAVFILCYTQIQTLDEPEWSENLLRNGALFNPFTLDQEWYRIFTSMFLHGHLLHLALNMFALFSVGNEVEQQVGSVKFLWVYFLSGIASALCSLYWNLFVSSVGASGAIFGLFGFSIIISLYHTRKAKNSILPILFNFLFFLGINLVFGKAMRADNAAHFGGLMGGVIIGSAGFVLHSFRKIRVEYALIPLLMLMYVLLPRYQVSYYKFFQQVLAAEDSTQVLFGKEISDQQFSKELKFANTFWDSAMVKLDRQTEIPLELQQDTFMLRRYISLHKLENDYRIKMIDRESYIYLDSMEHVQDSMKSFLAINYPLNINRKPVKTVQPEPEEPDAPRELVKIWFDKDWQEIPGPPAPYFRLGYRDSLNRWQGRVTDYYANGDVQMKGTYKDSKKDGVFLYYSDHKTYTSSGRYKDDRNVGKWETFHRNGKLESEVYYTDRYFLKSLWDSTGYQWIKDGSGKQVEYYSNGVVANEGEYIDGYKEGRWYGRHQNGELYYEENFFHGRLIHGKSRNLKGETFVYDESSQYPLPEGGYSALKKYLLSATQKLNSNVKGSVQLSFRVTTSRTIVDIEVQTSLSKELDEKAKQILLNGPRWLPAKLHGQQPEESYAYITIQF